MTATAARAWLGLAWLRQRGTKGIIPSPATREDMERYRNEDEASQLPPCADPLDATIVHPRRIPVYEYGAAPEGDDIPDDTFTLWDKSFSAVGEAVYDLAQDVAETPPSKAEQLLVDRERNGERWPADGLPRNVLEHHNGGGGCGMRKVPAGAVVHGPQLHRVCTCPGENTIRVVVARTLRIMKGEGE